METTAPLASATPTAPLATPATLETPMGLAPFAETTARNALILLNARLAM